MMFQARIVCARMLSPSVRELTFRVEDEAFKFVPGQWVSLRMPMPGNELLVRSYSIASAPRDDRGFDVAVTRVPGGPGSEWLHTVALGTELTITHAQGFFTLNEPVRPVLLVGTGTGVAPLRSMLLGAQTLESWGEQPVTLLFGVRTPDEILYRDEFSALEQRCAFFRFVPTLSRASPDWTGHRGYVQTHLREEITRISGLPSPSALAGNCDVYVCGLNKMIREVRKVLKDELGFTRERIHSERYD